MEIRVEHLWKSFNGVPVLRDVTFTAGSGFTCVMAPSGSGKTTLLRILLGLETADRGTVEAAGRWAAVFQEDRLLEHLDAAGNLRFALGRAYDAARAAAMLAELGLDDVGGKAVRDFSGGMGRRLALARALLAESDALALDEPFAGLDPETRQQARAALLRHAGTRPVLLVTHNEADAAALDARIIRLDGESAGEASRGDPSGKP